MESINLYLIVLLQIPREKGEGRAARQNANNSTSSNGSNGGTATPTAAATQQQQQQPTTTTATPPAVAMVNGGGISGPAANWERGYTPNTNWAAPTTPVQANSVVDEPQWTSTAGGGYQTVDTYDPSFGFHPHQQQGSFHAPAPVGDAFSSNGAANGGFRPRPSPQPQQIQIGGFSPHMSSPHPSPGSGQMNGRCGSVPPHFNGADSAGNSQIGNGSSNGYMNGSPFASPSPRPPSSNPPPDTQNGGSSFRNGNESSAQTAHPNGPPGYPSQSPVPHQSSSHNSNGYPGQQQQQQSTKGEQQQQSMQWDPSGNEASKQQQQRSTPHEELNNRLKEKILNKQQQQQQQQLQQQHSFQDQSQANNGQYSYMNYGTPYTNGGGSSDDYGSVGSDPFQPTSASSPSTPTGVRLDVHVENSPSSASSSTAHFLGQAHPQNSGTGGGDQQLMPDSSQQQQQQCPVQQQQQQQEPSQAMPHNIQQDQQQPQQAPTSSHCPNHHLADSSSSNSSIITTSAAAQQSQQQPANEQDRMDKLKNNVKDEVPPCQCFPSDQCKSPVR